MKTLECDLHDMWHYIERELPDDLEQTAYETGALLRHKGVQSAVDLLRVILTYGTTDLSLKATATWASSVGLGEMSSVALFQRIKNATPWLSSIISSILDRDVNIDMNIGLKISMVDATVLTGPGATETEWRLHTGIDPSTGHINSVKLTDQHTGESYMNYQVEEGEVVVGDRAYALATGIAYVHACGGYVVARANLHSIRLCDTNKHLIHPVLDEPSVPRVGVAHYDVLIPAPPAKRTKSHKTWKLEHASDWIPARLMAVRTKTGSVTWVITTVPSSAASDIDIMELYRVRWQIELEFKRLKSLLWLDKLPSRHGPTAESWILSRILASTLIEKLLRNSGVFSPWGYRLRLYSPNRTPRDQKPTNRATELT
jgi:hypothetical protein